MNTEESSRFVRLRVELVLEIDDADAVTEAALRRLAEESQEAEESGEAGVNAVPADERARAEEAVTEDTAEALAFLVDPFDLVNEVPGVELVQASWSSEAVDHDPDSPDWDLDQDDVDDDEDDEDDEDEAVGIGS